MPVTINNSAENLSDSVETLNESSPQRPVTPPSSAGKFLTITALVLAVAVLFCGLGFSWWRNFSSHEETDDAYVEAHSTAVSPRIPGTVSAVYVEENDFVHQGQLLARLDPVDYQIKVDEARAVVDLDTRKLDQARVSITQTAETADAETTKADGELTTADANIQSAQSKVSQCQAAVSQQNAQIRSLQAKLRMATSDYSRYQTLDSAGAVSKQEMDQCRTNYEVAEADLQSGQQTLRQLEYMVTQSRDALMQSYGELKKSRGTVKSARASRQETAVKEKEVEVAKADLRQSLAGLKEAVQQLSYTEIRAPISGSAGRRNLEVGQRVDVGESLIPIFETNTWITANFKETQLGRMKPGQAVEVHIDSFPGRVFKGKIASLAPASGATYALLPPENATGNFTKVVQRIPVKIVLDTRSTADCLNRITPGMSTVVSVLIK